MKQVLFENILGPAYRRPEDQPKKGYQQIADEIADNIDLYDMDPVIRFIDLYQNAAGIHNMDPALRVVARKLELRMREEIDPSYWREEPAHGETKDKVIPPDTGDLVSDDSEDIVIQAE